MHQAHTERPNRRLGQLVASVASVWTEKCRKEKSFLNQRLCFSLPFSGIWQTFVTHKDDVAALTILVSKNLQGRLGSLKETLVDWEKSDFSLRLTTDEESLMCWKIGFTHRLFGPAAKLYVVWIN